MKTGIRRSAAVGIAALFLTVTGATLAPSAFAAKSDCPRGYVCVWNNTSFSGPPTWKSQGNLYSKSSAAGISIFNNGVADPGADHIWWKATWANGQKSNGCLHYPPDGSSFVLYGSVKLDSAVWGGEC
ncbi:peptidase inhibitor family I36 protein [Streptomyces sp. NBC_00234]|uniref:peptidase inhibitor family I36 protein n=1 Tax=Streptomyces sp. NBC_00234 TaxID=2903638 RepID=UPI002E28E532|nr:peptidase inhibitor family I36 protein [Streptomyces sp. NBC_00234]